MGMPAQVRRAVIVLWLSLLISIITIPIEMDRASWNDQPVWLSVTMFVVGYGIAAAPIVFVARRHNWARIMLLGLTVLGVGVTIYMWEYFESSWQRTQDVAYLAIDIAALYWLFTGAGGAWFSKRGAQAQ